MQRKVCALPLTIFVALATFVLGAAEARATTYIVGTCKTGTRFTTIQDALNATPAPTIVQVCPGKYPEQVTISKPVTLEGIASGNSSFATLVAPSGGLVTNATLAGGQPAATQILVQNASGAVDLTNLVVDSSGADVSGAYVVGILYKNTPGTMNHMVPYNVSGGTAAYGIYVAGGSANPKVTVENSTIDHDQIGVFVQGISGGDLTVVIQNNLINQEITGIEVFAPNTTSTISGNVITGFSTTGMILEGAGSATSNTIVGGNIAISLATDGMSIKSNKIYNSENGILIDVQVVNTQVTGNVVTKAAGAGISINCTVTTPASKVHSNTFVDTEVGYLAPTGFPITGNTFIGVVAEWENCP